MRIALALVSCLLVGCANEGVSGSSVLSSLDKTGGCAGIRFDAWSTDRTASLMLYVELDAFSGPMTKTFDASELTIATLNVGQNLQTEACPDYGEGTAVVDEAYRATAGTLEVELGAPPPNDGSPKASGTLDGFRFETEDGATLTIDHFEIVDATVGWLAG